MQDSSSKMPPIFGAESMRESQLESSVLGSIIPTLDPDPPDPSRNTAFLADHTSTPAAGPEAKHPRPSVASVVTGKPSAPVSGKEGPREWAEGVAAAEEGTGEAGPGTGTGAGLVRGVVPGQEEAEAARRRKPRVKHGLRVLLRGTSRCGKSTILWDYCHRAAMAGYRVVLVCLKKNEGEELANLPRSMRAGRGPGGGDELRGWEAPALGRIGIKYVRSRDDVAWYLASLHTLKRKQWPTVIAVDDLDKIIETSAGGSGGGGIGAAALRILALLQDTAEFFDTSRSGALSAAGASAASASESTVGIPTTTTTGTILTPQQATERVGGGGDTAAAQPPPSGNLQVGGRRMAESPGEGGRRLGDGLAGGGQEEPAVRVVGTCSMSDRGMLSLYGRFVHAVARVQNTTGPDCFSLRLDHSISTAPHPRVCPLSRPAGRNEPSDPGGGFAPGFTPLYGGRGSTSGGGGGGGDGGGGAAQVEAVDFVRSQLDGSFAVF